MLVTCAYLVDASSPWVLQSLFLAAIGEARDRGFSVRSRRSPTATPRASRRYARFRVHRTVFPADFLEDFGFRIVRYVGPRRPGAARARRARPVEEGRRAGAAGGEGGAHAGADAGAPTLGRRLPRGRRSTAATEIAATAATAAPAPASRKKWLPVATITSSTRSG